MVQPNLGKKMTELRKAKGFTQEELAEKCNINVRTLQRIESGDVTPRSYTAKVIFAALDFNLYESDKNGSIVFYWLEHFYRYFLDLFNLKTNKMKKITILSIMFSAIILGLFAIVIKGHAQKENITVTQNIDQNSSDQKTSSGMAYSYFSCSNCFHDNGEMIGRDVKFKINGVTIQMSLIKLNEKTREFNVGFVKGKIFQNKVELTCPKDMINDDHVKYTADKIEKPEGKILLIGNARITSTENDFIETNEILITLN
jgi:transcriptional regulator with XRE-family HTH domain